MWNIVLGPPGTGKTTFLLKKVEKFLEEGTDPRSIAYLAFTKKAATEALDRAVEKFMFDAEDLPYFRTIHSLCYRQLNLKKSDVLGKQDLKEFGTIIGEKMTGAWGSIEGTPTVLTKADKMLFSENIARNRQISYKEEWSQGLSDFTWTHFDWFCRSYQSYKDSRFLNDYTDMLQHFLESNNTPSLDVLFIDEAQDLSALQWACVRKIAENTESVFVAGDDDQAIYNWAGADVQQFIDLEGVEIQLERSYRVPKKVHELANQIITRTKNRRKKKWLPRKEEGTLTFHSSYEHVDLSEGEWLILARNNYSLNAVEEYLKLTGVFYQRKERYSVRKVLLEAIVAWEALRKDKKVSLKQVKRVYSCISSGKGITRGKKNLKTADEDLFYDMDTLKKEHGLLVDCIWHEAFDLIGVQEREYLISCLRKEEKISKPRVKLSTIHGAKGGEADNVLVLTDIANSAWVEMGRNPEGENRTFYVAVTRTRENLHIVQPMTNKYFQVAY
tara:strand:+ start:53 stop:1552 length:1500 start_codon:yes stop_codon:yes gene_type:complete